MTCGRCKKSAWTCVCPGGPQVPSKSTKVAAPTPLAAEPVSKPLRPVGRPPKLVPAEPVEELPPPIDNFEGMSREEIIQAGLNRIAMRPNPFGASPIARKRIAGIRDYAKRVLTRANKR